MQEKKYNKIKASTFSEKAADSVYTIGLPYRAIVDYFSKRLKPFLDRITQDFIDESITKNHAENNPELKEMLDTKIRARPDAQGQNLDVIDAIPRTIIRSGAGIGLAITGNIIDGKMHNRNSRLFKWAGIGTAISIILNQVIELSRSVFRMVAGLQGAEAGALREYAASKENKGKNVVNAAAQGGTGLEKNAQEPHVPSVHFSGRIANHGITPEAISAQQAENTLPGMAK